MTTKEIELSPADQTIALALLEAVRAVFSAGCARLRPDQREGVLAALQGGHALEMRVRMLPDVSIACSVDRTADGDAFQLFEFSVPDAPRQELYVRGSLN